jgi:hypothetical protein
MTKVPTTQVRPELTSNCGQDSRTKSPRGCAVGIVVRQDIDEDGVQEPGMTSAQLTPEETAERNLATVVVAHFQQAALLEQQAAKTRRSRPKRRDENPDRLIA